MIFIDKNTVNKVVLTLDESSRLTNPFYLFEFKNEFNIDSQPFYFYTPDTSVNRNRYNLFTITESSLGSKTGGNNVPLNLISGQYRYKIYESSAMTLSLSATTGRIVEQGKMVVSSIENVTITTGNTKNIYY
jgi:hypothetical protein